MTHPRPAAVIVLAAGEGTRMKSAVPKVLHTIGGRSLLGHAIAAAQGVEPRHLVVVVRHARDVVAAHINDIAPQALVADQDEVKGTGRAAECGLQALPDDLTGTVLVTCGDVPLLTTETLAALVRGHEEQDCAATVVTSVVPDPSGYGRILRDPDGTVAGIVEQKDATDEQRAIDEINSGIYAFDTVLLREALAQVGTDNAQGEKYLTDVLAIARSRGRVVRAHVLDDLWQSEGVNDRAQLARLGAELNRRVVERWMREGVTVVDPATTWIDGDVTIGRDSVIRPGTQLLAATTIGAEVALGPDVTITSSEVGDRAMVRRAEILHAVVGPGASVGPYAYVGPGADIPPGARVRSFESYVNADAPAPPAPDHPDDPAGPDEPDGPTGGASGDASGDASDAGPDEAGGGDSAVEGSAGSTYDTPADISADTDSDSASEVRS